jgi:hypothetical protein
LGGDEFRCGDDKIDRLLMGDVDVGFCREKENEHVDDLNVN